MKLLSIQICRLTALFQITRNKGQLFLPAAAALASKYNFSVYPQSYEEVSSDKVEFRHGNFDDVAIETLELYNDGLVISSRSDTDFIDSFFIEICGRMKEYLEVSLIETHSIDRMYGSTIIFETDKNIFKPLDEFTEIANILQADLNKVSGLDVKYEPFGWTLSADPTQNPALKPISLRIERHVGIEFSLQHYISIAPLKQNSI